MTAFRRLEISIAFLHFFISIVATSSDYYSRVYEEYQYCCRDVMPTDKKELLNLKCYFTAAVNLEDGIYLFSGDRYWKFRAERNMLHPESNSFFPQSASKLGFQGNEGVYSVIEFEEKIYVETLKGSNMQVYVFDIEDGFKHIEAVLCGHPCSEAQSKALPAPLTEVSNGLLVIGSIGFKTKDNTTLTIVPTTKLEDPFEMKVESMRRYYGTNDSVDNGEVAGTYHTYAAFVMNITDGIQFYWTFHRYNWACFRSRRVIDDRIIFDYEERSHKDLLPQCMRTQIFFGCPQSFCYDHEVDDFMVNTTAKKGVVLFRGMYYWNLKASNDDIPLPLPLVANAKLIGKRDQPWPGVTNLRYIDAVETFTVDDKEVVIIFKDETVFLIVDGELQQAQLITLFPNKVEKYVSAAWYNRYNKLLFLFARNRFQTYEVSAKEKVTFNLNGPNLRALYNEFAGFPQDITSILSNLNDKTTYFLNDMWYYSVSEDGWKVDDLSKGYKPKITFDPSNKFYDTESAPCSINKKVYEKQYRVKIEALCRPPPATQQDFQKTLSSIAGVEGVKKLMGESQQGSSTFIIFISTLAVLLVLIALIIVSALLTRRSSSRKRLAGRRGSLKKTYSQTTMKGSRENLASDSDNNKMGIMSTLPAEKEKSVKIKAAIVKTKETDIAKRLVV